MNDPAIGDVAGAAVVDPLPGAGDVGSASLCRRLRAVTTDAHEALDRSVTDRRWLDDVDRYASFLARLATGHRAVEARLAGEPVATASGHRPKSHLVVADLARLGRAPDGVDHDPLGDLPSTGLDAAALVGMLYVVEGSTLGGRHLARAVHDRLPAARAATAFLDAYGDETPIRWRRTRRAIDHAGVDPDRAGEVALAVFGAFRQLLDEPTA